MRFYYFYLTNRNVSVPGVTWQDSDDSALRFTLFNSQRWDQHQVIAASKVSTPTMATKFASRLETVVTRKYGKSIDGEWTILGVKEENTSDLMPPDSDAWETFWADGWPKKFQADGTFRAAGEWFQTLAQSVVNGHADDFTNQPGTTGSVTLSTLQTEIPEGAVDLGKGRIFYPKDLGDGHTDLSRAIQAVENKESVCLYGPPGTGKTMLWEAVSKVMGRPMWTLLGSENLDEEGFLGSYAPKRDLSGRADGYAMVRGPYYHAITTPYSLFFLDEVGLTRPQILANVIYPVMDGRGWVNLPTITDDGEVDWDNPKGQVVEVAEGVQIVMAYNPDVIGSVVDEPLKSRTDHMVYYPTDYDRVESIIGSTTTHRQIITVAKNLQTQKEEEGQISLAPQTRELVRFAEQNAKHGTRYALESLLGQVHDAPVELDVWTAIMENTFGISGLKPLSW